MKKETLGEIKKIYLEDGSFGNSFDNEISDTRLTNMMPLIGEIVLDFNQLEDLLDNVINEFIFERSSDLGFTIIAKMTFSQKVDLFKNLTVPMCKHIGKPEMATKLNSIIKKLNEASENRNRAIHAKWVDADKEFFVRTKVGVDGSGVYGMFFRLDRKMLKKYLKHIQKLIAELDDDLYAKLFQE